MAKTAATRPKATDPATAKLFVTAPLVDGAGASEGGEEIEDGVTAAGEGDGEEDDDVRGDGGELTLVEVDGEAAGEVEVAGEGAAFGVFAADLGGDALGEAAGDCATAEKTNNAISIRIVVLERAILRVRERKRRERETESETEITKSREKARLID